MARYPDASAGKDLAAYGARRTQAGRKAPGKVAASSNVVISPIFQIGGVIRMARPGDPPQRTVIFGPGICVFD